MYIDQDDMNIYDDDGIFLTQPYACGSAFTVSVLDSLVSAVRPFSYFCQTIIYCIDEQKWIPSSYFVSIENIFFGLSCQNHWKAYGPDGGLETMRFMGIRH